MSPSKWISGLLLTMSLAAGGCGGTPAEGWPAPDDSGPGRLRAELLRQRDEGASLELMMATARQRRGLLREGWGTGQPFGRGALFPAGERSTFPGEVQRMLERRVDLDGDLHEVVIDLESGRSRHEHGLSTRDGARALIGWSEEDAEPLVGKRVTGPAWVTDDFVWAPELSPRAPEARAARSALVDGRKRILAIIGQWSLFQPNTYWSEAFIREALVDDEQSSATFYDQASRGDVEIELARVEGPLSIYPIVLGELPCNHHEWGNRLDAAARANGVEPNDYDHVMYFVPREGSEACDWSGIAQVGNRRSWIRRDSIRTISHELGHNFGMWHAGTLDCDDGGLPAKLDERHACNPTPTADPNDVMAYTHYRLPNAAHQMKMGWVDAGHIQGVTSSGTYTLDALHGEGSGPRVLHLAAPDLSADIYVSYRDLRGPFDDSVEGGEVGAEVHVLYQDAQDGSDTSLVGEHLEDGEQFHDPHTGLSVRQVGHDEDTVTVEVSVIPKAVFPQDGGAELVEDVAVGRLADGSEVALAVYHQSTGQIPGGMYYDRYAEVGTQHSQLWARVLSGAGVDPLAPTWTQYPPQPVGDGRAPTNYATRTNKHAAAAFDPARQSFVVVSSARTDHGPGATNATIVQSLHVSEINALNGQVTDHGEVSLGRYSDDCGGQECGKRYHFQDTWVDLAKTPHGYVVVLGEGGNTLNVSGRSLVMGRFRIADAPFTSPEDLDLRELPATTQAKWPSLTSGNGLVALAWTQAYGSYPSNRVAVLGYRDDTDVIVAPNTEPVVFANSTNATPLLVSSTAQASSGYSAWRPEGSYDPSTGQFFIAFTYRGDLYNWEVLGRSFRLVPGASPDLSPLRHLSTYDARWAYSGEVERHAGSGGFVAAYQEDDFDFFDGYGRVRIDFMAADATRRGSTLLAPMEDAFGRIRLAASPTSPWVYVARSGDEGVVMEAVRYVP